MGKKPPDGQSDDIMTHCRPIDAHGILRPLFRERYIMQQNRATWPRWALVGIIVVLLTIIAQGHEGVTTGTKIRLIPFQEYAQALISLQEGWRGARRWLLFTLIDGLGNLVVFMPLGAALDYALKDSIVQLGRRIRIIALIGGTLSTIYEITQLWIPGRVTAVDDVITNTIGTLLGATLTLALRSLKQHNTQDIS